MATLDHADFRSRRTRHKTLAIGGTLSRGFSGTSGGQAFNVTLRTVDAEGATEDMYTLRMSRQEVEETIGRWQELLKQYPAPHRS